MKSPHPFCLELKGNQLFLDNSTLSNITACPRKAAYGFLARRQEVKSRMALFFGGAIHKALEIRDLEQQVLCTKTIEEKMIDGLVTFYQDCDDSDDYRNLSYAIRTIEKYNTTWKADPQLAITLPDGTPAVELPFALPMGRIAIQDTIWVRDPDINDGLPEKRYINDIEIVFTGKIDRICEKDGGIYLLDHKTTSMGGPTFFDEFFTSHQFRGYKWATEQLIGTTVAGVIINGIICRPPLKSGDVNFTFDRQSIPIDSDMVEDWQESFMTIIETFLTHHSAQSSHSIPDRAFPMYTNSCITKYGKCEFYQVCQLTPNHRPAMLWSGLYENNTWSPLESEPTPKPKQSISSFPGLF